MTSSHLGHVGCIMKIHRGPGKVDWANWLPQEGAKCGSDASKKRGIHRCQGGDGHSVAWWIDETGLWSWGQRVGRSWPISIYLYTVVSSTCEKFSLVVCSFPIQNYWYTPGLSGHMYCLLADAAYDIHGRACVGHAQASRCHVKWHWIEAWGCVVCWVVSDWLMS